MKQKSLEQYVTNEMDISVNARRACRNREIRVSTVDLREAVNRRRDHQTAHKTFLEFVQDRGNQVTPRHGFPSWLGTYLLGAIYLSGCLPPSFAGPAPRALMGAGPPCFDDRQTYSRSL